MSQHDGVIDDGSGAVVRADLNNALQALLSQSAGTSAPSTTYANQIWADTTNHVVKQRNEANSAWFAIGRTDAEGLVTKSAGFTVGVRDFGKTFTCTAALTAAFTAAATLGDRFEFDVYNDHATGDVTLDPNASETINGATTIVLKPGERAHVICNGTGFGAIVTRQPAVPIAASRGLVAKNNAATPNSKFDIAADELVLKTAGGHVTLAASVSVTADIAVSGANGLDTGAEASNTHYFAWVIYNPATATVAALLSTSATAPTLPSGYTYRALVGAVRNDGSSNFVKTWISDRRAAIAPVNALASTAVSSAGTLQSLDISAIVPSIARTVSGTMGDQGSPANLGKGMSVAGGSNGEGRQDAVSQSFSGTALNTFVKSAPFHDVPLLTAQTLYWTSNFTDATSRIDVCGYTF